jgi:hypothetical protein
VVVGVVEGDEVKKDFAAMSGLAALGGFVMRQWMNYERRSLKYRASGTGQSGVTGPETQAFVIANVSCLKATAEDCKGRGLTEAGLPEPRNENAPGSCFVVCFAPLQWFASGDGYRNSDIVFIEGCDSGVGNSALPGSKPGAAYVPQAGR